MAAAEDDELLPRLPDLFETGQQLLDEVEVAAEPTGSRAVQDKVSKGLDLLKTAAEMLSQLDLFRYGGRGRRGNCWKNICGRFSEQKKKKKKNLWSVLQRITWNESFTLPKGIKHG